MRSPPCQDLLPSSRLMTFLLCNRGDISTWLQQCLTQTPSRLVRFDAIIFAAIGDVIIWITA